MEQSQTTAQGCLPFRNNLRTPALVVLLSLCGFAPSACSDSDSSNLQHPDATADSRSDVGESGPAGHGGSGGAGGSGGGGWGGYAGVDSGVSGASGDSGLVADSDASSGLGWIEEWAQASSPYFAILATAPNAGTPNTSDPSAGDQRVLELLLGANPQPTPAHGAEVETHERRQFGSFSTRLRTAQCSQQPNAGVVTGFFVYFNDGSDTNQNGLPDNSEIDFEWLCADPSTIYMTLWTDYRASDEAHKRVFRIVNPAQGTVESTCYAESFGGCTPLTGVEAEPATISSLVGYDSSAGYYEYGFDWSSDRVTWWFRSASSEEKQVLWDYRGPASRVTQVPAYFMTNVWHTANWPPASNPKAIEAPNQPVSVRVDWTRYQAL